MRAPRWVRVWTTPTCWVADGSRWSHVSCGRSRMLTHTGAPILVIAYLSSVGCATDVGGGGVGDRDRGRRPLYSEE